MVTSRNPRDINIPFPFVDGLERRTQEELYMDFLALGRAGQGARWRTIVIAASDSSAAGIAGADYRCSGTADQGVINTAISALEAQSGTTKLGRIVFLEGTYNLTATITVNTLGARTLYLEGMGAGVGVDPFGGSIPGTKFVFSPGSDYAFTLGGSSTAAGSAVVMENLAISSASSNSCVLARDMGLIVRQCTMVNAAAGCIEQSSSTGQTSFSRVENCLLSASGGTCVIMNGGSTQQSRVTGNYIQVSGANVVGIKTNNNASNVPNYAVTDNYVRGTGLSGTSYGIQGAGNSQELALTSDNVIVGAFAVGIEQAGFSAVISSNLIKGAGIGIRTGPFVVTDCSITSNTILGATTGISLVSGDYCMVEGNNVPQATTGLNIGTGVTNTWVGANSFNGDTTGIVDSGTGSVFMFPLPTGGTTGQLLAKTSNADGAAAWVTDYVLAAIAHAGDLIVGTAANAITAVPTSPSEAQGPTWTGQILVTTATAPGVKWGPQVTVGSTAPTSPRAGDIWLDTT